MARHLPSTRGMRWAYLFGLLLAFSLPKQVECGYPGGKCETRSAFNLVCHEYQIEPLGFYALEKLAGHDVGFAYSSNESCR